MLKELLDKYGLKGLLWVIAGTFLLWGLAHWMSKPGEPVKVLWGLVEYTKQQTIEKENSLSDNGSIPSTTVPSKDEVLTKLDDLEINSSSPPISNEIVKVISSDRVYVSLSIEQILDSLSGTSDLQIEDNYKQLYKGKWVRVRGPVSISGDSNQPYVNYSFDEIYVQFKMNVSEKDKFTYLPDGTVITVDGQFDYIMGKLKIGLNNGSIIEIN